MIYVFYVSSIVAIVATILAITCPNAMHALLYFVVSLLAVALVFYTLGAPFVAALEVITYAGAIMVLFLFVLMLLNIGRAAVVQERRLLRGQSWWGPGLLAVILGFELAYLFGRRVLPVTTYTPVEPRYVGATLLGPYVIGTELASMLLLVGLIGAYHLGRPETKPPGRGRTDQEAGGPGERRGAP